MSLLSKLERRFGHLAIPNVTLFLIVGQIAVYFLAVAQQQNQGMSPLLDNMQLLGGKVLQGEIWRLFSFVFIPPASHIDGLIFALIAWYIFYFLGSALETTWGVFRYNAFLLVGYAATVSVALIHPDIPATNAFYFSSVFLAFARLFPDYVFYLFFILPIKVKWLALLQWVLYGLAFVNTPEMRLVILAAVANYFLFFWKEHFRDIKDKHRRTVFRAKTAPGGGSKRIVHTCAVCGLSNTDEPRTAFRYCSQCDGQRCYCPDHIRNHEHVVDRSAKE